MQPDACCYHAAQYSNTGDPLDKAILEPSNLSCGESACWKVWPIYSDTLFSVKVVRGNFVAQIFANDVNTAVLSP